MIGFTAAPEMAVAVPRCRFPPRILELSAKLLPRDTSSRTALSASDRAGTKPEYRGVNIQGTDFRSWVESSVPAVTVRAAFTIGYGTRVHGLELQPSLLRGMSSNGSNPVNESGTRVAVALAPR